MSVVRPVRRRLDAELVRRNIFESREQAQAAIEQHRVLVGGSVAEKPSRQVGPAEPITLTGDAPRFVSRGGEKLDGALERFRIPVDGLVVLDAGASTGGFTDCLLQRGAAAVVAVDVGYGQLHERIRSDSRVEVHERINLRTVDVEKTFSSRRFKLVVGDLSFISLRSLASNLCDLCVDGADLVLLVKPQFEAGREEVSRGRGVIRDPETWRRTLTDVESAFRALNATMMDVMPSPITGADGNVEFLMWLRNAANVLGVDVPSAIEGAVRQATPEGSSTASGTE
jgi:23S rRNA (cytidine1920-2'-O)/16S rRNA (cytidine1409-2'-O)-methyltransferase